MPAVSQIALELIGPRRYRGARKLAGGYTNRVWRVYCDDGAVYIVKSYRATWTRANEEQAISVLGPHKLAPSAIYARSATVLIWPDDGLVALKRPRDGDFRAIGNSLRAIHDQPAPPVLSADKPGWRTVNRIAARGLAGTGIPPNYGGCVHGDPCLENALSTMDGSFVRFNDFEEFGSGDRRADFILCLLETACSVPDGRARALDAVVEGYLMGGPLPADEFLAIAKSESRTALAKAALIELAGWAAQNKEEALVARYRAEGPGAVEAIARLSF